MLPLTLIRRSLSPSQADAIMRRAWIVPSCFYASASRWCLSSSPSSHSTSPLSACITARYRLHYPRRLHSSRRCLRARTLPPAECHCHHDAREGPHSHRAVDHRRHHFWSHAARRLHMGSERRFDLAHSPLILLEPQEWFSHVTLGVPPYRFPSRETDVSVLSPTARRQAQSSFLSRRFRPRRERHSSSDQDGGLV